jgi:uncharacterized membrane protein (UPF0127 family)
MSVEMARILTPDGRLLLDRVAASKAGEHKNAKGLLGRDGLHAGEGLLLSDPTGSIHMFFMRFAIDAVFLTKDLEVVKVVEDLKPWRMARARGAKRILEIGSGEAARLGIKPGDRLVLDDAAASAAA